jgi:nitrile hydratase
LLAATRKPLIRTGSRERRPAPRKSGRAAASLPGIVRALGEEPVFRPGDPVRIATRSPVGHYRVPIYLRGKIGTVEAVIEPAGVDNEEEAYGRNAGAKRHYYRIAFPMTQIWPDYAGSPKDGLRIEVFETWLERI